MNRPHHAYSQKSTQIAVRKLFTGRGMIHSSPCLLLLNCK